MTKQSEARAKIMEKIEAYTTIIRTFIGDVEAYPKTVNIAAKVTDLIKNNPADEEIIKIAQQEAYIQERT